MAQAFFKVLPPEEARRLLLAVEPVDAEKISSVKTRGRVLAEDLNSMVDLPHFHRAAMDGYAVKAKETFGAGQSLPAYLKLDGAHIPVNTEKGRQKYCNMSQRRAATILAIDPDEDTRWLEVRGTVVGETEEGAREHIDELARLYLGVEKYPYHQEGDVRVLFKIAPQRVATMKSSMPGFGAST